MTECLAGLQLCGIFPDIRQISDLRILVLERYSALSVNVYFYLPKFLEDEFLRQGRLIITSVMSYVHPITSTSVSYDMRVA